MKNVTISTPYLLLLLCYQCIAVAYEIGKQSPLIKTKNSFRLATEYEYSSNIYKSTNNPRANHRLKADLELAYKRLRKHNSVSLQYNAEYQKDNISSDENSNFWTGKGVLSQQLFSKNFIFGAQHERRRFIIDERKSDLADNQTERDLFAVEQYWHIPLSSRARLSLHAEHSRADFDDYPDKNAHDNNGDISLSHQFSKKVALTLSYSYSDEHFTVAGGTYTNQQFKTQLSGQHRLGVYRLSAGRSLLKYQDVEYKGINYALLFDALIKQHFIILEGNRTLTDSSFRQGYENELDFFQNQLLWSTQVSLTHHYAMMGERLITKSRLYYHIDESINKVNSFQSEQSTESVGISSQLNWKIDERWTSLLDTGYRYSNLYTGQRKQFFNTTFSGRFNITPPLYVQMSISLENQTLTGDNNGYDEVTYSTRMAYTF